MALVDNYMPLSATELNTSLFSVVQGSRQQLLHYVHGEANLVPFVWPLDNQQARVTVEMLAVHHATHVFHYPGCLCPMIHHGTNNNETILFLAPYGEHAGRLVVACARGACGYIVDLYSFYLQPEHLVGRYPRRHPILPGGLTYVADNPAPRDLAYFAVRPTNPETQRVKIGNYEDAIPFLPVLYAPQTNEPRTISNMLYRLFSTHRPGLTQQEFANIIAYCEKCGLVATRRKLSVHEEQCGQNRPIVMTEVAAEDVRCLDDRKFLTLLYQLDNSGPGLTTAVLTQMFSMCCCGMVTATRRFNLHECRETEEPPIYE